MTRRLVGVSLKAYMSPPVAREWLAAVAELSIPDGLEVVVFPEATLISEAVALLSPIGVSVGAQDVSLYGPGPHTGQLPASHLADLSVRYAMVGHAEVRADGDDEGRVRSKAEAIMAAGIVPWLCVDGPEQARDVQGVVAYEPVASIGADAPARPELVADNVAEIRKRLSPGTPVLYGGSAGPGTATALGTIVDGIFLGRFAHDPQKFAAVLDELASLHERNSQ